MRVGPNTQLDVSMRIRSDSPIGRREVAVGKMITDNRKFLTITDAFNVSSRFCPPGILLIYLLASICIQYIIYSLGRRLIGMSDYRECLCDEADVDIISCDGSRVHIEVCSTWQFKMMSALSEYMGLTLFQ